MVGGAWGAVWLPGGRDNGPLIASWKMSSGCRQKVSDGRQEWDEIGGAVPTGWRPARPTEEDTSRNEAEVTCCNIREVVK